MQCSFFYLQQDAEKGLLGKGLLPGYKGVNVFVKEAYFRNCRYSTEIAHKKLKIKLKTLPFVL